MRVLQIVPYIGIEPSLGGIPPAVKTISEGLASAGCSVVILSSDWGPGVELENVEVWRVKTRFRGLSSFLNAPLTPDMLGISETKIRQFDVIHMHGMYTFQNIVGYLYARRFNIPYILQVHGSLDALPSRAIEKRLFLLFLGRRMIRQASGWIALGESEASAYVAQGVPESRVRIIPNPAVLTGLHNHACGPTELRGPSHSGSHQLVGFLGRLHVTKRIDMLIEATRVLTSQGHDVHCEIVGPNDGAGQRLKELTARLGLRENVTFRGRLSERKKWEFLRELDVLVLPAFSGFPITILEALRAGTPVVVTRLGKTLEDFSARALCVADSEPAGLANAIERVLEEPEYRDRLLREGRYFLRTRFSRESVISSLLDLYLQAQTT